VGGDSDRGYDQKRGNHVAKQRAQQKSAKKKLAEHGNTNNQLQKMQRFRLQTETSFWLEQVEKKAVLKPKLDQKMVNLLQFA